MPVSHSTWSASRLGLHGGRAGKHGRDDVLIAGAAADIAFEPVADIGFGGRWIRLSGKIHRAHDHARACRSRIAGRDFGERPAASDAARSSRAGPDRPSIVVTEPPSSMAPAACSSSPTRRRTCTTQAPHWLVSQPTWVPVRLRFSRSRSATSVDGSMSTVSLPAVDRETDYSWVTSRCIDGVIQASTRALARRPGGQHHVADIEGIAIKDSFRHVGDQNPRRGTVSSMTLTN